MITVYSAICGGKDKPRRDDVLCFSEYDRFKDPRMNAKIYKVLAHKFIVTEYSIWIDGNIQLTVPPEMLIELMGEYDCAVFQHPERKDIYQEGAFIIQKGKDGAAVVGEQLADYRMSGWSRWDLGMCGIIMRRHTRDMARRNEQWWSEICRYSARDQLSFPVVFSGAVRYLPPEPINGGRYHKRIPHGS